MALLIPRAVMAVALVAIGMSVRLAARQETIEPDVKAAFIYNFTKFVDWPPSSIPADGFRICTSGDARVATALASIIAGESAAGRPLVMAQPQTGDEARRCQILYVGAGEPELGARLLAAVRQSPVFTAGEGADFAQRGGAIGFLLEDNRVRFDIDLLAVQQAGLRVSSKLLRIARQIRGTQR
jgi:hypothetical protein